MPCEIVEKMSEDKRITASVKWYNTTKGFGFLTMPNGGLDCFVHANQLRKSGITRALIEGEQVSFMVSAGPKGQFATEIKILRE